MGFPLHAPTTIGIIGTAGRHTDEGLMSKPLFEAMLDEGENLLNKWVPNVEHRHLVSGGSAWSDHVAVRLFLQGHAQHLTLYIPAPFISRQEIKRLADASPTGTVPLPGYPRYQDMGMIDADRNPGGTLNYYHHQFARKMGESLHQWAVDISDAIEKGAELIVEPGFMPRNRKIAEAAELLFAYTWSTNLEPTAKGGTAYTWRHSNAKNKIHVPLSGILNSLNP